VEVRQQLLDTPAERVSPELAQAVTTFCKPIRAIRAAYVGLIEISIDGGGPERHLGVGFALADLAETVAGDRELHVVAERFYDSMPEELQRGGCSFLEGTGLDAWQEKAQEVYSRP
jgi:hypothetical protein